MKEIEFPVGRIDEITKRPEDFRLIERIPFTLPSVLWPLQISESLGDDKTIILLDTETTGLDSKVDTIIELGMVKVTYSASTGKVICIDDVVSLYQDPGKPIKEEITALTGITNEMVKDQQIDSRILDEWLSDDYLIAAHNAAFDRPFFEKQFPRFAKQQWACSIKGIDWKSKGYSALKLESLLSQSGYFYEGHRASIDCLAMAWLFHLLPEVLLELVSNSEKKSIVIHALKAPFDVKDALKDRGYRWFPGSTGKPKCWWTEVDESLLDEEKVFLDKTYRQGSTLASFEVKTALDRFKR